MADSIKNKTNERNIKLKNLIKEKKLFDEAFKEKRIIHRYAYLYILSHKFTAKYLIRTCRKKNMKEEMISCV